MKSKDYSAQPDPQIKVGDQIAYVHTGRDFKKMFLYSGKVKQFIAEDRVEVDGPARVVEHALTELGWTGKRWEVEIDTTSSFSRPGGAEAPRKRGGIKRGR